MHVIEKCLEPAGARGVAQLAQRPGFDLANTLAGDGQGPGNLLQRVLRAVQFRDVTLPGVAVNVSHGVIGNCPVCFARMVEKPATLAAASRCVPCAAISGFLPGRTTRKAEVMENAQYSPAQIVALIKICRSPTVSNWLRLRRR